MFIAGHCRPAEEDYQGDENDEYQGDDDYGNYDDESGQVKSTAQLETNDVSPAYFAEPRITVSANESQNAVLPCDVKNRKCE